jgi:hypothetical protein
VRVSVTDSADRGERANSRNETLQAELARTVEMAEQRWRPDDRLCVLLGVTSAAEAGRRAAAWFIRRSSYWCNQCEQPFAEGDVVYRRKAYPEMVMQSYCCDCKYPPSLARAANPRFCEGGCGVLVSGWYGARGPLAPRVCSVRCSRLARNARRRRSTIATCCTCGKQFQQRRSDARYCSNACRQGAYRRRKRGIVP